MGLVCSSEPLRLLHGLVVVAILSSRLSGARLTGKPEVTELLLLACNPEAIGSTTQL
jgi:hypothetical protein